ncbi:RNA-binding protein 1-like [Actinidia eriantha]|uniref:RNA-binding protein 1-like n=1 Tax=Actinidia eriantha TaxID=165200 RepID=UPI00258CF19A|nr:RNA-binding protein 1-like [Actinidia eriantha]XP_057490441.1 RNA-binding protein 1-like [Actinidia eriantha]XP_057490442.1 RNA-binding protein 1-like [Actinidia eriantha]XP_057490443.1 RNA-binding protein 1-like [Actinidia eriantha]
MADGYWNRQPPQNPSAGVLKRPRSDYDLPPSAMPSSAHVMHNYLAQDDDRGGPRVVKDTKSIGSAYDRYLQNQINSSTSGEAGSFDRIGLGRSAGGGIPSHPLMDSVAMSRSGAIVPDLAPNVQGMGFDGRLPMNAMPRPVLRTVPLPRDASNTIYVEGLPPDSTRREVAHIFRPFVGYREVRLVSKESKHRGRDPLILCFVDFMNPACAATALSSLQGYKMDEHDPDSPFLRLQFSKHPGPKSRTGSHGKE